MLPFKIHLVQELFDDDPHRRVEFCFLIKVHVQCTLTIPFKNSPEVPDKNRGISKMVHYGVAVRIYLDKVCANRRIGRSINWPPRSQDLTALICFVGCHL